MRVQNILVNVLIVIIWIFSVWVGVQAAYYTHDFVRWVETSGVIYPLP